MAVSNLTLAQIESIVIDAGLVYLDYGLPAERLLAPTRGGNTFTVEREIHTMEVDGVRGKAKGLRRIVTENAMLMVRLLGLAQENLAAALPGATYNALTGVIAGGSGQLVATSYLTNVTLIGEAMGGRNKVITLFNALADGGLTIAMTPKEEAVVEVVFSAHYDPVNLVSPIYRIEEVAA